VNIVLITYLIIFALFGTAASYFVRFIYAYWIKKEMPMQHILKAGMCIIGVLVLAALIPFLV
jgi:hypothetical protein